jgi:hypothetical protein
VFKSQGNGDDLPAILKQQRQLWLPDCRECYLWNLEGCVWLSEQDVSFESHDFARGWGIGSKRNVCKFKHDLAENVMGLHLISGDGQQAELHTLTDGGLPQVWTVPLGVCQVIASGHGILVTPRSIVEYSGCSGHVVDEAVNFQAPAASDGPANISRDHSDDSDSVEAVGRHVYSADVMVNAIRLSCMLRNRDDMKSAVVAGLEIANTDSSLALARDIVGDVVPVPSGRHLQKARVKLDCLSMLFRRSQMEAGVCRAAVRFISADSSPQMNFNYLCVHEEIVTVCICLEDAWPLKLNLEARSLPVSTLVWGEASLERKFSRLIHVVLLESGVKGLDQWRHSVRGCLTDEGVEKHLNDVPHIASTGRDRLRDIIERLRSGEGQMAERSSTAGFFFEQSFHIPGHAHMIFGGLESAVEKLKEWSLLERCVRGLVRFFKGDGASRSFCRTLLQELLRGCQAKVFELARQEVRLAVGEFVFCLAPALGDATGLHPVV